MKVIFYGATLKAAEKKGKTFVNQLKKMKPEGFDVAVTSINDVHFIAPEDFVIPNAYKFQVSCDYILQRVN